MVPRILFALALVTLTACGGAPAAAVTAQGVTEAFTAAGLTVADIKPSEFPEGAPIPRSFKEQVEFTAPGLAPEGSGGQVFVCDTKQNCDAIYAYFDALKALAGPYLYRSGDGRVVAQLNSGMKPEDAAKFQAVVEGL